MKYLEKLKALEEEWHLHPLNAIARFDYDAACRDALPWLVEMLESARLMISDPEWLDRLEKGPEGP